MELDWEDFETEDTLLLLNGQQVFQYSGTGSWMPLGSKSPDDVTSSADLEKLAEGGTLWELIPNLRLMG